jgi:hypothetical protein
MPKRSRKPKRTTDINQIAHQLVGRSTEEKKPAPAVKRLAISQFMAEMGRMGGKKGGKARAAKMTPEQRSKSASDAARIRWDKQNGEVEK